MPLTLFLEYVTPPRIILPRVLGVCFVENIPVKQMVRDQFSEGEFNFVWLEFFLCLTLPQMQETALLDSKVYQQ